MIPIRIIDLCDRAVRATACEYAARHPVGDRRAHARLAGGRVPVVWHTTRFGVSVHSHTGPAIETIGKANLLTEVLE